ncbi:hypothetical protein Scep_029835 [Stephania cephalantha]|uniref:Uncharacterized protein n=1 Tax=Stephania cephalantha TaxID=152367 RepID=A0AAP0E647_9MAGN
MKMKALEENLATAGAPMSIEDLISNTLLGLDQEYLPIVTVLQSRVGMKWSEFQGALLHFETTISHMQRAMGINPLSLQDATPAAHAIEVKTGISV